MTAITRTQVLSYGGGTQTVAMCLLARDGVLPRPDRIVMADTGREGSATFDYLENFMRPALETEGMRIEIAPHSLATVDLYSLKQSTLVIPAFTATGKFKTYCSNEWKSSVNERYLRSQGIRAATFWIGYTIDESKRIKGYGESPWFRRYPLVELMLTRSDCEQVIYRRGLPKPPKSACWMCPHRTNAEWRFLRDEQPSDFEQACVVDEEIRENDEYHAVYLHEQRVPLRDADLEAKDRGERKPQCGLGNCFL